MNGAAHPSAAAAFNLADVYRSEVTTAHRLGYRVGIDWTATGITVRLQPTTPRARAAARRHGQGDAIHATASFPADATLGDRLDIVRETIRAALALAYEAAA